MSIIVQSLNGHLLEFLREVGRGFENTNPCDPELKIMLVEWRIGTSCCEWSFGVSFARFMFIFTCSYIFYVRPINLLGVSMVRLTCISLYSSPLMTSPMTVWNVLSVVSHQPPA